MPVGIASVIRGRQPHRCAVGAVVTTGPDITVRTRVPATDPQPVNGKADTSVPTRYDDIERNEVLWITPEVCRLPESPGGFALRVDDVLGHDYGHAGQRLRVWVRGPVLLDARSAVLRTLTLCVPVDQPRAVPADPAPAADTPPHPGPVEPARAVGRASTGLDPHKADEPVLVQHAGRLYRRVEVPGR